MQRYIPLLIIAAIGMALVSLLHAQPYLWFTDQEMTRFGDRSKFWHGDTLDGPVHSNSMIAVMQDPVFTDIVTSTADDFWRGSPYNPLFLGPHAVFNVPRVQIPDVARSVRSCAMSRGNYFPDSNKSYFAHFTPGQVKLAMWDKGQLMDTVSNQRILSTNSQTCIFVNGSLWVYGLVGGEVSIGAAGDIHIIDDIRYADTDTVGNWLAPGANHNNYLGLVSAQNVKIDNTPANGRWNSSGRGNSQTNLDSTSVVVTASVVAQGESFTFDQQNDPDSGYVCDCQPDDRGWLYFYGSLIQARRGYVHRATRQSTGYLKRIRYDRRLYNHRPPGYPDFPNRMPLPDTVNFGNVAVGQMAVDTVEANALSYGALYASYPFTAQHLPDNDWYEGRVLVRFAPPRASFYSGMLTVGTVYGTIIQIPVRGRGVPAAMPPLALEVSPNPFNLTTTMRYSLRDAGDMKVIIFDLLGRAVRQIDLSNQTPGEHQLSFNASELATGVYFVRMQAGAEAVTRKVLLLK